MNKVKAALHYVELKTGFSDNGPAWIGSPNFSKSKATLYFDGKAFKSLKGSGIAGNFYEAASGDEYWISGMKKSGTNRHPCGGGVITVDEESVEEYLNITGQDQLPKNFRVGKLAPSKPPSELHAGENEILTANLQ